MPSETDDPATEACLFLIARLPDGLTSGQSAALTRLLRCLDGVQLAQLTADGAPPPCAAAVAEYCTRYGVAEPVVIVSLARNALIGVLSGMLQMGCRGFAKIQHKLS